MSTKKKKAKSNTKNEWFEVGEEAVLFPFSLLVISDPKQKKRKSNKEVCVGYLNLN